MDCIGENCSDCSGCSLVIFVAIEWSTPSILSAVFSDVSLTDQSGNPLSEKLYMHYASNKLLTQATTNTREISRNSVPH